MVEFLLPGMFIALSIFWFIRQAKAILFWLYLWQLKEYRFSRLLDYFQTEKGKRILLSPLLIVKFILLFTWLIASFVVVELGIYDFIFDIFIYFYLFIFFLIYLFEGFKAVVDYFLNKLIKPVFTKKIQFLFFVLLIFTYSFLFFTLKYSKTPLINLLVFDIFIPLIVSAIILIFQPLAILGRNRIIKKAIKKREQFNNLLVIGITGSYGKTSTKEFLYTILSEKFNVLKTKEHQNTEIGVSQCVLNDLKPEHQIFIVEMGAYCRGEIKLLCDIAKPKIGILTGINEQHLATFGSLEGIIKTKYELIQSLPADGMAFFNAKNKYCVELYEKTEIKKFLYGENVELAGLENIEVAKMVAKELGMQDLEISRTVDKIENKFAGIQIKQGISGLKIIDATYSANPDSVIAHLDYVKTLRQAQGKIVIVMPCLIELGKATIEVHKRIGQKIGEVCDLAIITTKERFKEIKETAGSKAVFMDNPKEIFEQIKRICSSGDIVLLESRVSAVLIKQLIISD